MNLEIRIIRDWVELLKRSLELWKKKFIMILKEVISVEVSREKK